VGGAGRRMAREGVAALGLLALCVGPTACGADPVLTEADCRTVAERLTAAWQADANDAVTLAKTDQFRRFVADEGKSIAERWMAQCRTQVGRPVDAAELECLRRCKRIEDVEACARRYGSAGS
jgi:hypothetical protein